MELKPCTEIMQLIEKDGLKIRTDAIRNPFNATAYQRALDGTQPKYFVSDVQPALIPTPPLIFLDIDGVRNDHEPYPNQYCGTLPRCVEVLNALLAAVPTAQLVISSAWRYLILNGSMTLAGFEALLLTHGVDCSGRVFGCTGTDEMHLPSNPSLETYKEFGTLVRAHQIEVFLAATQPPSWVVLDDLNIPVDHLVQTNGRWGMGYQDDINASLWLSNLHLND